MHDHNLAGVVTIVEGTRLHVQRNDHSDVVITLDKRTKYRLGKEQTGPADLVVGRRVFVTYRDIGSEKLAKDITLAREDSRVEADNAADPHSRRP